MHKLFHCEFCGEKMPEIKTNPTTTFWLDDTEPCTLMACDSADCKNRGVVLMLPSTPKDD